MGISHLEYCGQGIGQRLIHVAEQVLYAQDIRVIAALIEDGKVTPQVLFHLAGYVDHPGIIHYVTKRTNGGDNTRENIGKKQINDATRNPLSNGH